MSSSSRRSVRQGRFPPEFRIPEWPETPPVPAAPPENAVTEVTVTSDLDDDTIAVVATNLWRVLKRFGEPEDGEVPRAQRMAVRNLEAVSERLAEAGVRVQDHDGIAFDAGMTLKVLAYEPRPNVTRETVVETVRPSVYRATRCIQIGHVIVGMPEKGQENG